MILNGKLKNGNPSGDPNKAPRCGAHSRRTGNPCKSPAIRGRNRCRMHGGRSTGAVTAEGIEKVRKANWVHGGQSLKAKQSRQESVATRRETSALLKFAMSQCRILYKKPKRV